MEEYCPGEPTDSMPLHEQGINLTGDELKQLARDGIYATSRSRGFGGTLGLTGSVMERSHAPQSTEADN